MKFLKKTIVSVAALAAVGFAATAHAGVIIDVFTQPLAGQIVDTNAATAASNVNQAGPLGASVLGGWRDMSVVKTTGNALQNATAFVFDGKLEISNDNNVRSTTVITWDGSNVAGLNGASVLTTGLGGADLTFGGTASEVVADVFTADLGFNYKIRLWDMDGSAATLAAGVQFGINGIVPSLLAHYDFAWFNLPNGTYCDGASAPPACSNPLTQLDFTITRGGNMGAIDFTKIGAVQLEFSATVAAVDLSLGSIRTVPEPGALALVGMALLGVGAASRRRATKG